MIAQTVFDQLLSRVPSGSFTITYPDGKTKNYGSNEPEFHLTFKDEKVLSEIIKNFDLGFGEAYMDGRVEVDHLDEMLRIVDQNFNTLASTLGKKSGYHFQLNAKRNQSKQISSHYDLGNDFYKLWLGDTMTYTCAYFHEADDSLETAQRQKIDHVLRKLQLQPGQRFVDIGCGWGYLVVRAAKLYGAHGLGVTLSREQYEFASALAEREGVAHLAKFELMNYQDLIRHDQTYDRVVSVGVLEHVGRGNHREYFEVVNHLLAPGGISVLHSITQQKEDPMPAWIDKYIFPGGYIPSVREITHLLPEYGFQMTDYENLRMHYALTLDEWSNRFEANLDKVQDMGYDERFIRMWRLYLRGSASSFRYGKNSLSQWIFTKGLKNDNPLTREYLYLAD